MPRANRFLLAIACALLAATGASHAQLDSPAPTAASTTPAALAAPTAVPLAEAIGAADAVAERLAEIESEVSENQTSAIIARELPLLTEQIDTREAEMQRTLEAGRPLASMQELETAWQRLADQLALWNRELSVRATHLDREIALLPDLRTTWRSTLAAARSSAAPPEVTGRIDGVLRAIAQVETTLQKRRGAVLSLQSRVAEQTQRVAAALRAVKSAQSAAVSRLWTQDSAPIWSRDVRAAARHDLVTESQASFSAQATQLSGYLAREWTKLLYLALIFCGFSFVLAQVRQRAARWTDQDPALERANRILQLPFATAGVLTFLFCKPIVPEAPRLFWIALATIALVPIVILLRRLIDRHLFPIVNALVVFYVIAQVRALVATLPVLSRTILLLEMIGGAVFLAWFIHSTRAAGQRTTSRRATRAAARLGVVLFLLVFITNSLGYVALANHLAVGALTTAYLAILLYAAAGIVEGLTYFALQIGPLALLGVVQRHRSLLRRRIARVIYFAAFAAWLLLSLDAFSLRRPVVDHVSAFINAELAVRSLHLSLGGVLAFALTVWVALLLSRFVRFILEEDVYARLQLARGSSYAVSTILHYAILLAGFFAALAAVGVDMTKFAIFAGAFGVGIGFGLQHIFNNFFSGLILLFERPVRVGDVIAVGGVTGLVQRIGIRASVIRLPDNSELIVPNGQLISEKVTNRTLPSRQARIDLRVGVAYDSDPQRVIELLTKVAAAHPLVASQPPAEAFMKEFGADALMFDLVFWTDVPVRAPRVHSDVAVAVNTALRDAKITIPFPQRSLHLQSIEPSVADALQPPASTARPPDSRSD